MADKNVKNWFKSGAPWVWLTGAAVAVSVIMVVGLLGLIAVRGLGFFWPADVQQVQYRDAGGQTITVAGEIYGKEAVLAERLRESGTDIPQDMEKVTRFLFKIGNRDVNGMDFRWLMKHNIESWSTPENLFVAERREWGNFYGYLKEVKQDGVVVAEGEAAWPKFELLLQRSADLAVQIRDLERTEIGSVNYRLERLRLKERGLELDGLLDDQAKAQLVEDRAALNAEYGSLQKQLNGLHAAISRDALTATTADGRVVEIPLKNIVRVHMPNAMNPVQKLITYFSNVWAFVSGEPREANTEGGVFPAIFGTVMMVIIMSIFVTPFGVVAAVYLREYAKQGFLTRVIRIAVNNLAGVPAIVYGVFGLGFFVYFLGGNIDALFFPEALPAPTFGTPGLLWASLTLAILTVPVVIVATEEGLSRIPRNIREGSLALGATKWETLWKTVIPMASPAMMTGLILAIARAAGEVAPLMLVGVVKLAPTLPMDGNFPYVHLDYKIMHLGFHIYDVGFQSPNVEAARPLVYATALLLVLVIIVLNIAAIAIRNRLRERYKALDN
ncbi:MAG: phosphate ABC transporter permease PstA [Gammaproteobacteria bacterium]|nr:phosphate ABC transporter permease PstA [Gammaproteobacteria bacterium]